jgi:hypothetical protein
MLDDTRNGIQIVSVEKDGEDGMIVAFSDGTTGAYVVEELLGLRPYRQLGEKPEEPKSTTDPNNALIGHNPKKAYPDSFR